MIAIRVMNVTLRLALGAVFVFAGALKIFEPAGFAADIANYRLLPLGLINLLAIALPWIELVAGLMLILGVWVRASALVVAAMCVVFFVAIGQALARGLDITCGCFGTVQGGRVGLQNLAIDLACLLAAGWLTWRAKD